MNIFQVFVDHLYLLFSEMPSHDFGTFFTMELLLLLFCILSNSSSFTSIKWNPKRILCMRKVLLLVSRRTKIHSNQWLFFLIWWKIYSWFCIGFCPTMQISHNYICMSLSSSASLPCLDHISVAPPTIFSTHYSFYWWQLSWSLTMNLTSYLSKEWVIYSDSH